MEKSQKRGKKTLSFSVQKEVQNESLLFEQIDPQFNEDETNDFNLKSEKKAALSSMITNLKTIRKSLECTKLADIASLSDKFFWNTSRSCFAESVKADVIISSKQTS